MLSHSSTTKLKVRICTISGICTRIAHCAMYVYVPMLTSDMSGLQRCWLCLNRALYPGLLTPTYVAGNDIPGRVEEWHIPGKKASKRVCCRSQTRTIE